MMGRSRCAVPGCAVNAPPRHRFPNYKKDFARFLIWLDILKNENLSVMTPNEIYRKKVICHHHFEEKYISTPPGTKRLLTNAIPTLFLENVSVPDGLKKIVKHKKKRRSPNTTDAKGKINKEEGAKQSEYSRKLRQKKRSEKINVDKEDTQSASSCTEVVLEEPCGAMKQAVSDDSKPVEEDCSLAPDSPTNANHRSPDEFLEISIGKEERCNGLFKEQCDGNDDKGDPFAYHVKSVLEQIEPELRIRAKSEIYSVLTRYATLNLLMEQGMPSPSCYDVKQQVSNDVQVDEVGHFLAPLYFLNRLGENRRNLDDCESTSIVKEEQSIESFIKQPDEDDSKLSDNLDNCESTSILKEEYSTEYFMKQPDEDNSKLSDNLDDCESTSIVKEHSIESFMEQPDEDDSKFSDKNRSDWVKKES